MCMGNGKWALHLIYHMTASETCQVYEKNKVNINGRFQMKSAHTQNPPDGIA